MAVLITGGTGFIGSRVAAVLLERGHSAVLVDNAPDRERHSRLAARFGTDRVELAPADVLDTAALDAILSRDKVDGVVHLAYMLGSASRRHIRRSTEVNLVGTANVLELARAHEIERVVCASSVSVFGSDDQYPAEDLPLREDAALLVADGLRLYGGSKVYLEAMAAEFRDSGGPLVVGLRPSIVYGGAPANGSIGWVYGAVASAAADEPTTLAHGDASVNLIHVDDLAEQFAALVEAPAESLGPGYFYNSGGDTCTIADVAEALRRTFPGVSVTVEPSERRNILGLAADVSGEAIDALVGRPRRLSPIDAGIRQYARDIHNGRIHS